ncbi:hypothetical protein [Streptomyces roseolilacinus]|uniref:Uncharacterized protein n=1 Tax=Streptomyces roseolilacinus TaxID=66904 RepID=A0A918EIA3_9ACTN|nr:hypothetical protein [Streptomyces roseolilacinus]GGP95278.1 hypothetical protein GCM10010249_11630 [Streptomyces roseolilacinus]
MNRRTSRDRARERSRGAPGAGSGAEDTAHRRDVPGTASTAEGYRPDEGTAAGEQLAGVEEDHPDRTGRSGGTGRGGGGTDRSGGDRGA